MQVSVAPEASVVGVHPSTIETGGGVEPPVVPDAAGRKATISARYRSDWLKVKVAATGPGVDWMESSVAVSTLLSVKRRVNPVPAEMLPK